jgi:hypothetical protein
MKIWHLTVYDPEMIHEFFPTKAKAQRRGKELTKELMEFRENQREESGCDEDDCSSHHPVTWEVAPMEVSPTREGIAGILNLITDIYCVNEH